MFSFSKSLIVATVFGVSAPPAFSAVMDIFVTGAITTLYRDAPFSDGTIDSFSNANIGDSVFLHWILNTEEGDDFSPDPGDNSEIRRSDPRFGDGSSKLLNAKLTVNGFSRDLPNNEYASVSYADKPDNFSLDYITVGSSPDWGNGLLDFVDSEVKLKSRPDSYATHLGLANEFAIRGQNLGTGFLYMDTQSIDFAYMRMDYQINEITTMLHDTEVAPVPLPGSLPLLGAALIGFGLLRRRFKS